MVLNAGRTLLQAAHRARPQEKSTMRRNRQIDPGVALIRGDPFSTPRPIAPKRVMAPKKVGVANDHRP